MYADRVCSILHPVVSQEKNGGLICPLNRCSINDLDSIFYFFSQKMLDWGWGASLALWMTGHISPRIYQSNSFNSGPGVAKSKIVLMGSKSSQNILIRILCPVCTLGAVPLVHFTSGQNPSQSTLVAKWGFFLQLVRCPCF